MNYVTELKALCWAVTCTWEIQFILVSFFASMDFASFLQKVPIVKKM